MKRGLVGLFLLWAIVALADPPGSQSQPKVLEFSIPAGRAVVKGVEYSNPGKPTVILVHGLTENSWDWQPIGREIWREGDFNVKMINLPDSGKGDHRTAFKNERLGDYGFDPMLGLILPAVVDEEVRLTGKPVAVIGHSMGGILAINYAEGNYSIGDSTGKPGSYRFVHDDGRARELASTKLFAVGALGTPDNFKSQPEIFGKIGSIVKWPARVAGISVPLTGRSVAPTTGNGGTAIPRPILRLAQSVVPRGIFNTSNVSFDEFEDFIGMGLTSFHADLGHDFGRWTSTGDFWTRDGFNLETKYTIHVPLILGGGDEDELAKLELMQAEAEFRRRQGTSVSFAEIRQTSHEDMLLGKRGKEVGVNLARRLRELWLAGKNPSSASLASWNQNFVIGEDRPRSGFRQKGLFQRCMANAYGQFLWQ